jgi:hypothetical protein
MVAAAEKNSRRPDTAAEHVAASACSSFFMAISTSPHQPDAVCQSAIAS